MTSITKWDKQAIVKAIMADVPKVDKVKRRAELQAAIVKRMSPECRKVYNKTPSALRTQHMGDLTYDSCNWSTREIVRGDVDEKEINELCKQYKEQDEKRYDIERKIKSAIESCRTLKQLNDRLPEFKDYFPKPEVTATNLPALANVVADLSKLGWPKKEAKPTTN